MASSSFPVRPNAVEIETRKLRSISKELKIDIASRVDLRPRTAKELTQKLRRLRRRVEIISVYCESKTVARQAAKDRRVDLLNFPAVDYRKRFFDRAEAELAKQNLAALEIDIKPLLVLEGPARIRLMSTLRRETVIAQQFHIPIVISSGVSDLMLMRKPRDAAALASLFGLSEVAALEAVSKNPQAIVTRNRAKLKPEFVAPGIRILKEVKKGEAN